MGLPGGRAWWELNMARLMEAMQLQDFQDLHRHEPAGLGRAREAVTNACGEIFAEMGIDSRYLILGGFSQGAMLSMDVALRGLATPPAVLFQYSGTVICESQWLAQMEKLVHTEVIQSHGAFDPILPYSSAEKLYEMLKVAGVPVQFHPFDGPHTLSYEAIAATAVAISRVVDSAIAESE
jgi:phospholipase/carboxylesterase